MVINEKVLRCLAASLTILIADKRLDGEKTLNLVTDCNFDELYKDLNEVYKIIKTDES